MILYIVRGLPGSGKSTYAKSLNCFHIENDMMKIKNGVYDSKSKPSKAKSDVEILVDTVLRMDCDVVVSNVFHTLKSIQPFLYIAKLVGAQVKIIKVTGSFGNIHSVPVVAMRTFAKYWENIDGEEVV